MKVRFTKILIAITTVSFFLNLIWENVQAPLYGGYTGFGQHFLICLLGTLGDVVIILLIYSLLALLHRNTLWFKRIKAVDYCILIVLGGSTAVLIEQWALSTGRWHYNQLMPVISFFNVGLLPFLQMLILPPVIFYVLKQYWSKAEPLKLD